MTTARFKIRYLLFAFLAFFPACLVFIIPDFGEDEQMHFPVSSLPTIPHSDDINEIMALPDSNWAPSAIKEFLPLANGIVYHWLRVEIPAIPHNAGIDHEWIAEIQNPYFNTDFYLSDPSGVLSHTVTGIDRSVSLGQAQSTGSTVRFQPGPTRRFLYIRSEGVLTREPNIHFFPRQTFERVAHLRQIFLGLLIGALLTLCLVHIVIAVSLKQSLHILRAIVQIVCIFLLLFLGVNYRLIHPALQVDNHLIFKLAVISGLLALLCGLFIEQYAQGILRNPKSWSNGEKFGFFSKIAFICLAPFVPEWTCVVFLLSSLVMGIFSLDKPIKGLKHEKTRQFIVGTIWGFLMCSLVTVSALLQWIDVSFLRVNAYLLGDIWLSITSFLSIISRIKILDKQRESLHKLLDGNGPKTEFNTLLRSSFGDLDRTLKTDVSIVFIDIVAFSRISAGKDPEEIFMALSRRLRTITETVQRHGGSIDRSLGDGMLCFFGYQSQKGPKFHAKQAFDAACEVQRLSLDRDRNTNDPLMPVRIGIHSALVTIGDLGESFDDEDVTMIGSGVNFASRLETACNPFKIVLSERVKQLLVEQGAREDRFASIYIPIKHQADLAQAFEFDPLADKKGELERAERNFLHELGMTREQQRYSLKQEAWIRLESPYGPFELIDFSPFGCRAFGPRLLGRGTVIRATLVCSSPAINVQLEGLGIQEFSLEVRWSRSGERGLEHGLRIYGGNPRQHALSFGLLRATLGDRELDLEADEVLATGA